METEIGHFRQFCFNRFGLYAYIINGRLVKPQEVYCKDPLLKLEIDLIDSKVTFLGKQGTSHEKEYSRNCGDDLRQLCHI